MDQKNEKRMFFFFALTNWVGWLDMIDYVRFRFKYGIGWYELFHGDGPEFLKNVYDSTSKFSLKLIQASPDNNRQNGGYRLSFSDGNNEGEIEAKYKKYNSKYEFSFDVLNEN